jgi:T4-like virus tail tube protein gp19
MTKPMLPLQRSRFKVSTCLAQKKSRPAQLDGVCEVVLPKLQRVATQSDERSPTHLILRRGVTRDPALAMWWRETLGGGDPAPRNVMIAVLAPEGEIAAQWTILNARPEAFSYSTLNALDADVLIESLELSFEGADIEITAPPAPRRTGKVGVPV